MARTIEVNEAPRFMVSIAGKEMTQSNTQGLEHLVVEDHVDMMGMCRVTLNMKGLSWDTPKIGGEVEAQFGGDKKKIFKGYITALRYYRQAGSELLTVIALDPLCKLGASRVTKIYEDQSDSDIVSAVLGRAGVTKGKVDSTSGSNKYVIQRNESDLNFLKRLASRNGYLLLGNEGKVDFVKAQFSGAQIEVQYTDLISLDYTVCDSWIPPELTVIGWNYEEKKKVEGTASKVDKIGGGKDAIASTGQIWQQASYISDVHVADQSAAKAMAEGELNRLARNFVRGRCTVQGSGKLHAGKLVKFVGLRENFAPEGFLVGSKHIVEPNTGYMTEFRFASNTAPV